jgi:hypothetical protein
MPPIPGINGNALSSVRKELFLFNHPIERILTNDPSEQVN